MKFRNFFQAYWFHIGIICFLTGIVYYHALYQIPRSDHLPYFFETAALKGFWALTVEAFAFNRSHSIGDHILFRPVLYFFLGMQRWAWGHNYFLWQATSLGLHMAVVVSLYNYFRFSVGVVPFLAFAGSLFFALLYSGTEMVAWQHISGYLLFVFFAIQAAIFFRIFLEQGKVRDGWVLFLFLLAAAFTFELGNVLAGLMGLALLAIYIHQAWVAKMTEPGGLESRDRRRILFFSAILLFVPVSYFVWSLGDYWVRTGGWPYNPAGAFSLERGFRGFFLSSFFWLEGSFGPALLDLEINTGGRMQLIGLNQLGYVALNVVSQGPLLFFPLIGSWNEAGVLLNGLAGIFFLIPFVFLVGRNIPKLKFQQNIIPALVFALTAAAYVWIIVLGRELERGIQLILVGNTYYAYIFMVFVLMAGIHLVAGIKNGNQAFRDRFMRGSIVISLVMISIIGGAKIWEVHKRMRFEIFQPRARMLEKIIKLKDLHRDDADFSFTVEAGCPANDKILWFASHGKGKREVYFLDFVLFPLTSKEQGGKYTVTCDR